MVQHFGGDLTTRRTLRGQIEFRPLSAFFCHRFALLFNLFPRCASSIADDVSPNVTAILALPTANGRNTVSGPSNLSGHQHLQRVTSIPSMVTVENFPVNPACVAKLSRRSNCNRLVSRVQGPVRQAWRPRRRVVKGANGHIYIPFRDGLFSGFEPNQTHR